MTSGSGVVPGDWRSVVIILLYKGRAERAKCSDYRGITLLSVIGKIYASTLVERVRKVAEGLMDNEQGGFRAWREYVDQIFILKQIGEKTRDKKYMMWVINW